MSNRPIEDELRERFRKHQTPLDTNALWEQVEPQLPKKRKRLPFLWIWGLLGLGVAGLFYWSAQLTTDERPMVAEAPTKLAQVAVLHEPKTVTDANLLPAATPPPVSGGKTEATTPENPPAAVPQQRITANAKSLSLLPQPAIAPAAAPKNENPQVTTPTLIGRVLPEEPTGTLPLPGAPFFLPKKAERPAAPPAEEQKATQPPVAAERLPVAEVIVVPVLAEEQENVASKAKVEREVEKETTRIATATAKKAVAEHEMATKAVAEVAKTQAKAQREAEKQAARTAAAATKKAEAERKVAAKAAAEQATADRKVTQEATRLAKLEAAKAEGIRRAQDRLTTQRTKLSAKNLRKADQQADKLARQKAKNIAQDQAHAAKLAARKAQARAKAAAEADKSADELLQERLQVESRKVRREAELQGVLARNEAFRKKEAERRAKKAARLKGIRAKRAQKAREWLAKRYQVTPEEEQKEFLKNLEEEARKQRLAFAREEAERQRQVREITKRNKVQYAEADRASQLAAARKRRTDQLARRLAQAEEKRALRDERLAVRAAKRQKRTLAKGEKLAKPKKIRDKQSPFWTVEPGVAMSLANRTVTAGGDATQAGINEQYENPLEGISVQGLVGYHRPQGLSVRSGLVLSKINSRVSSETITRGAEPRQAVIAIILNPDGTRREQTGTVQVAAETKTTARYYNSVSSFDIPLLVGYRFGGSKLGLMLEAGPTFNLRSGGSAHLFDGQSSYRVVGGSHFRSKLSSTGWLLNFGGAYQLTETTSLTANLRLQNFGSGGFEVPEVAGYSTQYTLLGVQLGYRIRF